MQIMLLTFDTSLAVRYASASQKVRVLTEDWVERMIFCPNCGQDHLVNYENNRPVADFYCQNCQEDFELKSKNGKIDKKIVDGAYETMIKRLQSDNNPNFFLLGYTSGYCVCNFVVIPKQFFTPSIIERRKPLADTARRAGWVGCNILLSNIPDSGKIYLVRDGVVIPRSEVLTKWRKTLFLREENKMSVRGWMLDIMRCIEKGLIGLILHLTICMLLRVNWRLPIQRITILKIKLDNSCKCYAIKATLILSRADIIV